MVLSNASSACNTSSTVAYLIIEEPNTKQATNSKYLLTGLCFALLALLLRIAL